MLSMTDGGHLVRTEKAAASMESVVIRTVPPCKNLEESLGCVFVYCCTLLLLPLLSSFFTVAVPNLLI